MATNPDNSFIKKEASNISQSNQNTKPLSHFQYPNKILPIEHKNNLVTNNQMNISGSNLNTNAGNHQWYSYMNGITPNTMNSYYSNYTPFNDQIPNDHKYIERYNNDNSELNPSSLSSAYSKVPLTNQINQYISFQNHFHCYPFPIFHYVPFYPSNFNPQMIPPIHQNNNSNTQHKSQSGSTNHNEAINRIEFLFSFSYLNKDIYFRSSMDEHGWMPLDILMTIISIKQLHIPIEQIVQCLNASITKTVELKTDNNSKTYYIRKVNWQEFSKGLLNIDQIKTQKLIKPQNHYLCSYTRDTNNENNKEFTGVL